MKNKICCRLMILGIGIVLASIQNAAGRTLFEKPADPEYPVLMKFTFWNVGNPFEIENGAKPILTEMGPYVYEETRDYHYYKNDSQYEWYSIYKQWQYRDDLSCEQCNKNDQVTILNMPLIGAVAMARNMGGFLEKTVLSNINSAMNGEHVYGMQDGCCNDTLFVTKGVDDLLFGGISDGIVRFLMEYSLTAGHLPPQIQKHGNGFAIMNPKNGTTDNEWYQVDKETKVIVKWGPNKDDMHEDLSYTHPKWWPAPGYKDRKEVCNKLEGTDGQQFPVSMVQDKLWIFSTDICRSMSFVFKKEVDVAGVKAHRFTTSAESQWVNRTDNFCFSDELSELYDSDSDTYDPCIKETDNPEVLDIKDCHIEMEGRNGLLDLHHCYESPLVVSNPHFYQAEQELANIAIGMYPDPELHETQIDVDPITGTTLNMHKRIQFNMPLRRNYYVDVLSDVPEIMFPILWIDEGFV